MKRVRISTSSDHAEWLRLAAEMEPLFGPMVHDPVFREWLVQAIQTETAFCVAEVLENGTSILQGGIVISKEANEILWLAVAEGSRGRGTGTSLLAEAIDRLDGTRPIAVTTFDRTVKAGLPARRLYESCGFTDSETAGMNPAGIPIVVMTLVPSRYPQPHSRLRSPPLPSGV